MSNVMRWLAIAGKYEAAVDAFREIEKYGISKDLEASNKVMDTLVKEGSVEHAYNVFMEFKDCIPVDLSSFNILIHGRSGRLKDAWDVFVDMKKQGVSQNLLTYNTMISCACTHLEEENALKLLQRMEEDSCKPDIKTYASLLKMCCRKKRMKVLKFLSSYMFKNNVSIELSTYTLLVNGLCKSGKLDMLARSLKKQYSRG
ncbi:hypothetical protein JCGZ_02209 [Jatropha curcas]|uniref:Pentacotripeptide-repeat region of PRORP domain-containing protein n=1 Tax=Jatropha curcas TaxID=180498 RepID=A0A067KVK9_JATCU|nr:hypothetical protein JCGZ_02209 [Jatropha curcas]